MKHVGWIPCLVLLASGCGNPAASDSIVPSLRIVVGINGVLEDANAGLHVIKSNTAIALLDTWPDPPVALQTPVPSPNPTSPIGSVAPKTGTFEVANDGPDAITFEFQVNKAKVPSTFVAHPQSRSTFVIPSGVGHWYARSENLFGVVEAGLDSESGEFAIFPSGGASLDCYLVTSSHTQMTTCGFKKPGPEASAVEFLISLRDAIDHNDAGALGRMVKFPLKISMNSEDPDGPKQTATLRSAKDILKSPGYLHPDPLFLTAAMRRPAEVTSGVADCATGSPDDDLNDAIVDWTKGAKAIIVKGHRTIINYNVSPCSNHSSTQVGMLLESGPRSALRLVAFDTD